MQNKIAKLLSFIGALITVYACASMGNPQGGPYDETPPKVVKCTPVNQAVQSKQKRINILFDEYIKLENASEKVVISPPQKEMPDIRTEGKRISIELYDTLQENTTYTIDFSDAIVDNNEGNPMGHFTYSFSTGEVIDTMEVGGTILNAADLEPIKGILVGLHRTEDSLALRNTPLLRVARTNGSGAFRIKGVAPGAYRVYALQDADGDFIFNQKIEKIAFDTTIVIPSCGPATRNDTIWRDSTHIDSIKVVNYTEFYPNNLVLRAFQEEGQERHLLKIERMDPYKFSVYFTAPSDSLPVIKGFNFNPEEAFVVEASPGKDTITYWIPDTTTAYMDTLALSMTYLDTDTLGQLVNRTDTFDLAPRTTREKLEKIRKDNIEKWEKDQEKKRKMSKKALPPAVNPYLKEYMSARLSGTGGMAPNQNVTITFDQPIGKVDSTRFSLKKKVDTLWVDEPYLLLPVKGSMRSFRLYGEWKPKQEYRFVADTAAFVNILGTESQKIETSIRINALESYGALFVRIDAPDTTAVVQLLNSEGTVISTVKTKNKRADFYYLPPSDYYLRCYLDNNQNGKWDTGSFDEQRQPEEMFYFPRAIPIKALMEIEQQWDLRGIPWLEQKPKAITKQKPDVEKKIIRRNQNYNP